MRADKTSCAEFNTLISEANTFSVSIDDWDSIQDEFLSTVFRINGYPWLVDYYVYSL